MFRIAIEVRDLISSNVSSALDRASDPAKLLLRLQREIEEALVGLTGEMSKARRYTMRLAARLEDTRGQIDEWQDKAKSAMNKGREDLARQALIAREDTRLAASKIEEEIAAVEASLIDMQEVEIQLEAKRDDVRMRLADQLAADRLAPVASRSDSGDRTVDRRLGQIEALEKRTGYALDGSQAAARKAAVNRELDDMRRESAVDSELAALRAESGTST
ncbi:PspA/IM30 family protein [Qipengyuania seohaensis]|uniref:PspA/IM30 family protein n=1 Tax=Qipengyuania seohaensis TaxID=266951 RepID=UPI000C229485|nr:PspA/IM30 family protein [Qipengyuania seohaensis]